MEKIKPNLITIYVVIGILYTFYGHFFGDYKYRGFAYNLGRGIVWPATMFPSVGSFLGGIIIIAVVGYLVLKR